MIITVRIRPEQIPYLEASARLRNISMSNMVRKVMTAVLDNQLIVATVDDDADVAEVWGKLKPSARIRARARRKRVALSEEEIRK